MMKHTNHINIQFIAREGEFWINLNNKHQYFNDNLFRNLRYKSESWKNKYNLY